MYKFLMIFILSITCLWSQDNYKTINNLTQKVIDGDNSVLKDLYRISLNNDKEIKPQLVKAITLLMLKSGSTRTSSYLKAVNSKYTSMKLFQFLDFPPLKAECSDCKGYAKTLIKCRKCQKGDCRNCKGEGFIVYGNGKSRTERKCVVCKETGLCPSCKGTEKAPADCRTCRKSGLIFNRKAIKSECDKALKVLLHKSAALAGLKADEKVLGQEIKDQEDAVQWLDAAFMKKMEWAALEKKRILASVSKRKRSGRSKTMNGQLIMTIGEEGSETYEEGGSTSTLDHICKEISEYLQNQERKSKQSILVKCYGQFLSDVATVHIQVTPSFSAADYDYRQRAAEGFYRFTLLRAQSNGYQSVDFKMLDSSGAQIGGVRDGKFWLQK